MISKRTLTQAARRLVDGFDPERIVLFGSQARGTADERSDVDLLVVVPVRGKRRALTVAMDRSLRGLGFARDIIVLTPERSSSATATSPVPSPVPHGGRGKFSMPGAKEEKERLRKAREWTRSADEDLRLARHGLSLKSACPYRLIAYHAQAVRREISQGFPRFRGCGLPVYPQYCASSGALCRIRKSAFRS